MSSDIQTLARISSVSYIATVQKMFGSLFHNMDVIVLKPEHEQSCGKMSLPKTIKAKGYFPDARPGAKYLVFQAGRYHCDLTGPVIGFIPWDTQLSRKQNTEQKEKETGFESLWLKFKFQIVMELADYLVQKEKLRHVHVYPPDKSTGFVATQTRILGTQGIELKVVWGVIGKKLEPYLEFTNINKRERNVQAKITLQPINQTIIFTGTLYSDEKNSFDPSKTKITVE